MLKKERNDYTVLSISIYHPLLKVVQKGFEGDYFYNIIAIFQDFLEDLWDRIQVLSSNGWKVESGNFLFYT